MKPDVVAFIPVRGGSKSIPNKNIHPLGGRPLVYWTLDAAVNCDAIDLVYVSTDSLLIRDTVERYGSNKVKVIDRSPETATDEASTESAMLEFAKQVEFNKIVLIQATSPLLETMHLDQGVALSAEKYIDSIISVVRQKRFLWREDGLFALPNNYDPLNRPRRQEHDGYLVENGAFYITTRERLLMSQCRVSGNIGFVEMPEATYFEIDEPSDWIIMEQLLKGKVV